MIDVGAHNASPVAASVGGEGDEQRRVTLLDLEASSPDALERYVAALGDASWRVRKTAVMLLPRVRGLAGLTSALVAGLGEEDNAGLRNACAEALVALGAEAVTPLESALAGSDADHRKFIVEVLGTIATPEASATLLGTLDDADENVRAAVAESLGRVGGDAVIAELERRLDAAEGDLLQTAYLLGSLADAGAKLSLEALAPYVAQPSLTREVFALLGLCGNPAAATELCRGLGGGSAGNRAVAVRALARLSASLDAAGQAVLAGIIADDLKARAGIERALEDEDDSVASAAVDLLGRYGEPGLAPRLLRACACRPFVQRGVEAVLRHGEASVIPLLEAIERVDVESRVLFLEVLEVVADARVVAALAPILSTFDTRSAEAAVRLLGNLGEASAAAVLVEAGGEAERELWRPIALALARLARRHGDAVAAEVRTAIEEHGAHPSWLLALGEIGRAEDIGLIDAASHDQRADLRRAALEAAEPLGDLFPEETSIFALADEQPAVRAAAARALGAHAGDASAQALLAAARDPEPWVAAEALRSLGRRCAAGSERTMLDAAGSTSSVIAIAALQALLRCNPPGIEGAVRGALRHADPEVVREALDLSLRLDAETAGDVLRECLGHRFWNVRSAAAELLANRRLPVDADVVQRHLARENEDLVREALEELLRTVGGAR